MTILVLDGYNLLHRARSGFTSGEFSTVYNFFRGLRPLIEQFKPTRVYMALEGHARARYELLPEYKANRIVEQGTPKHESLMDFHRQKKLILELLERHFPVSLVRHPHFEADDTIYNIIKTASTVSDFVVVSSDTDFTQLLVEFDNVKVYNPVKKSYVEWDKSVSYVVYKALKGDSTDNIPGLSGFGEKTAMKLAALGDVTKSLSTEQLVQYQRNIKLVGFEAWTDEDKLGMTSSSPARDWDAVKTAFDVWGFVSITKDKTWKKFVDTFDTLFNERS